MSDSNSSPVGSTRSPDIEKAALDNVEQVHTNERVLGHTNYHEKHGLRTYGDGEDHDHEPPMSFKRAMSLTAMALLWTGSKIPVYQFGGIPPYIYADLGGTDRWIWFVLANLLSLAAVCPFVGSLSDLMGRRYVAILGAAFVVLGMIICSTAHTMNIFISGMVFAGVGAGINELTALAVTSELAPTAKRGKYVAILILTIIPFCPSVLWGQLIASKYPSAWRWVGLLCGIYNFIGLLLTAFFYFPPPRINSQGLSRNQILGQIDWVGGALSIPGMVSLARGTPSSDHLLTTS
ncbi:hypothetical protein LTR29_018083 [Friedmanniomyces endolithicus]|nr:hypothetical protein LTR29_018083 [Friedmanniomyces endolithicus]